jgi:hypothetical protein
MSQGYVSNRIYARPLLPRGILRHFSIEQILNRTKRNLIRRLRAQLLQTPFSPEAKAALQRSLTVRIKPSSLQIVANHPAFRPLVEGQRRQQMTWLTKAKRPIPIVLDSGKLIFRKASPRSMMNGRWWHPGRDPSDFLTKAKKETREYIKKQLVQELKDHVRERFVKAASRRVR